MCGIFAVYGNYESQSFLEQREKFLNCSKKLRHRGPDWNGIYINESQKTVVCHERLSIIDVDHGAQPLQGNTEGNNSKLGEIILSVNGEIYNHQDIKKAVIQGRYNFKTGSDC